MTVSIWSEGLPIRHWEGKYFCLKARCHPFKEVESAYPREPLHAVHDPDTDLNYNNLDEYKFINASATKISRGPKIGGIGILNKASGKLLFVEKISDRIIAAELKSNPQTTYSACYCGNNTMTKN